MAVSNVHQADQQGLMSHQLERTASKTNSYSSLAYCFSHSILYFFISFWVIFSPTKQPILPHIHSSMWT